MWELIGNRADTGIPAKVRFDDGLTSNDSDFMVTMEAYALNWGLVGYTPVGPYVDADLSDETASYLIAYALLNDVELTAGEAPKLPDFARPLPGQAF